MSLMTEDSGLSAAHFSMTSNSFCWLPLYKDRIIVNAFKGQMKRLSPVEALFRLRLEHVHGRVEVLLDQICDFLLPPLVAHLQEGFDQVQSRIAAWSAQALTAFVHQALQLKLIAVDVE